VQGLNKTKTYRPQCPTSIPRFELITYCLNCTRTKYCVCYTYYSSTVDAILQRRMIGGCLNNILESKYKEVVLAYFTSLSEYVTEWTEETNQCLSHNILLPDRDSKGGHLTYETGMLNVRPRHSARGRTYVRVHIVPCCAPVQVFWVNPTSDTSCTVLCPCTSLVG
jgi:hypothetical protein